MNPITIAIAGLGSRGKDAYAQALKAMPERAKIVAIADPDPVKVQAVAQAFSVPADRCVYFCDNNVVDHQVVNLEMEGGLTVSFTMCAFTADGGRTTKFMGTHGSMIADMSRNTIEVRPFGGETTLYDFNLEQERMSGHAGGDSVLVAEFLDYIQGRTPDGITSLEASMESHFICMAAEESRVRGGACVEMAQFRNG